MSSFVLKIIACICMFCDHLGNFYYKEVTFLNYIGRFAFTIFAFQIAQGYVHTHNIKKYISRLTLFAFISQLPFMLFFHSVLDEWFTVNVVFTLLFGLLAILIYDKYNKFCGICSCITLGAIAQVLHFDYGFYGVFLVFLFYLLRNKKIYMVFAFIPTVLIYFYSKAIAYKIPFSYLISWNPFSKLMYFTCLSIIPILFYNGKKGKDAKYLFYIFYPLHLLILGLISLI